MTIFVAIVGLGLLIFVHELGHFVASLALRMRPRKFYIGFPPAVLKTKRNGIEYGLGAIPLGGFVKIPGMHRPAPADVDHALGRALEEAPGLAGPVDRLRGALAAGDHDTARDAVEVLRGLLPQKHVSPGPLAAAEKGLTDLEDALGPDAYWRAATWKRVIAIAAGPAANVAFAFVLFTVLFMVSGGRATTVVEEVAPDAPAAAIGLRAGDRIVEIGGTRVGPRDISRTISGSDGRPLTLVVMREGTRVALGPAAARRSDDGVYRLGFVLRGEGLSLPAAAGESGRVTALVTRDVGVAVGRLVTGDGRKDIASPVGIVQGSSDAAERGADSFLWVLGLISLSIALLNLLPLLPLDGGHIVFALLEGARGRAVRREIYERVSFVGLGLVLLLFFIGLSNDINRLS
ncbi:MAG: site-2 protease family protein [Thermoleophilia bacterium]|nr:site-2 protease family protein [Thermoleophilia bacterium]